MQDPTTFKCEVVTPLFLFGADQRSVELREQSLRGIMRFWFRAMMGGVVGDNLNTLRRLESEVFGSTERASSLVTRLMGGSLTKRSYNLLLHKQPQFFFEAFNPGGKFDIEINVRPHEEKFRKEKLQIGVKCLYLLSFLGGLGRRTRRGFGTIRILSEKTLYNRSEFKQALENNLRETKDTFEDFLRKAGPSVSFTGWKGLPNFSVVNKNYSTIAISNKSYKSWEEAIRDVGQKIHNSKNHVFGLPLGNIKDLRRASPLMVRVHRLSSEDYFIVFSLFKSEFHPRRGPTDWTVLDNFLNQFNITKVTIP